MTARTRTRVASATPGESLSTRETVPMPTPARSATSRIRGARGPGRSGALATTRARTPAHDAVTQRAVRGEDRGARVRLFEMARHHLRPLFDRVVIKELEPDRMRQSGLVVPPGSHEPPPQHGIVLAVGQGVDWWEAAGVQMPVRPGDHVVFPASAGAWVEVDEERLLVCRVTELLGVLERVEEPLPDARLGDARGEG